jgi:hypothetical protein
MCTHIDPFCTLTVTYTPRDELKKKTIFPAFQRPHSEFSFTFDTVNIFIATSVFLLLQNLYLSMVSVLSAQKFLSVRQEIDTLNYVLIYYLNYLTFVGILGCDMYHIVFIVNAFVICNRY